MPDILLQIMEIITLLLLDNMFPHHSPLKIKQLVELLITAPITHAPSSKHPHRRSIHKLTVTQTLIMLEHLPFMLLNQDLFYLPLTVIPDQQLLILSRVIKATYC